MVSMLLVWFYGIPTIVGYLIPKVICLHSVWMTNCSIWSIDRTLSDATTLGQSGPGNNGNEGVLCIPQSSSITIVSPLDCLVPNPGHLLEGWVLPLSRDAIDVFYSPSLLGYHHSMMMINYQHRRKEYNNKIILSKLELIPFWSFEMRNKFSFWLSYQDKSTSPSTSVNNNLFFVNKKWIFFMCTIISYLTNKWKIAFSLAEIKIHFI